MCKFMKNLPIQGVFRGEDLSRREWEIQMG